MSGQLVFSSLGAKHLLWTYDTTGAAEFRFPVPIGSTEGTNADTIRAVCGSPMGTVWALVLPNVAGTPTGPIKLKEINPTTGETLRSITLTGIDDAVGQGGSLALLPDDTFLCLVVIGPDIFLKKFNNAGATVTTYGVPVTTNNFALLPDGNTIYYGKAGSKRLFRWNLATDAALSDFGDLGAMWIGNFIVMPDGGIVANYPTECLQYTVAGLASVNYLITNGSAGAPTGMSFDASALRLYISEAPASGATAGAWSAYQLGVSAPLFDVNVPVAGTHGNTIGPLILTPPLGAARAYAASSTTLEPIRRRRRCPHLTQSTLVTFYGEFRLVCRTGAPIADGSTEPQIALSYSDEGGEDGTFSEPVWLPAGAEGQRQFQVWWQQLGSSRDRVFQVDMTSAVPMDWLGAFLRAESGTN